MSFVLALRAFTAGMELPYGFPMTATHWTSVAPWWVRAGKRNPRRNRR